MVPTYSINPGTGQEAETYTQISDVLNLIPDNTQKLISPRDVRDAVFSNWENSIFRYTTNTSATEYIGIARDNIKDVRLFFGKKELSGSSILSDSVLAANSDTDIFFYNTKSDSDFSQDLKISFLAGSTQSLHLSSPYLKIVQEFGATASLGLELAHNQIFGGDFNFQAGSGGRISINNLVFPSVDELSILVSSATSSSVGDLFLVRTNSGFVELRTPGSIYDTLGTPGSPTNIYGSPVNLNGYPLEFTDINPTIYDFGGVSAGSTFSNVPIVEMLRQLLYPYLGPLTSITISTPVVERDHITSSNIALTYTLTKRSSDIISSTIYMQQGNGAIVSVTGPTLSGAGFTSNTYPYSYTFSASIVQYNSGNVFTFSVAASDGTQSYTSSSPVNFVYPYFYGFSSTLATAFNINTVVGELDKIVDIFDDQIVPLRGTGYLYYCYPSNYGELSYIYDQNGYILYQGGSASTSWTYSNWSVSSPSAKWGGVQYRIYRTILEVDIPAPQKNYQFNFTL